MSEKNSLLNKWLQLKKVENKTDAFQKLPVGEVAPASLGQKRLWYLQQLYPDNPFYTYAVKWTLDGEVDCDLLKKSFTTVSRHHDILRTVFDYHENVLYQKVLTEPNFIWKEKKDFNQNNTSPENELYIDMKKEAEEPFNLQSGPLIKLVLYKLAEKKFMLLVSLHHIIMDKWSMKIFREELFEVYAQLKSNHIPNIEKQHLQYSDFAYDQSLKKLNDAQLLYWKQKLKGASQKISFPTDFSKPTAPTFRGQFEYENVKSDLFIKIKAFCSQSNTTPFTFFLAVFKIVLARYSNQPDLLVGVPISNRESEHLENMIGFFDDTILIRSEMDASKSFQEFIQALQKTVLDAFQNKQIPFEALVRELKPVRTLHANPFFQKMFVYHVKKEEEFITDDMSIQFEPFDMGVAKFDLTFYVEERNHEFVLIVEYAIDLFEKDTIEKLLQNYLHIVQSVISEPAKSLSTFPLPCRKEQKILISDFNAEISDQSRFTQIQTYIEQAANENPNGLAVQHASTELTYSQLNQQANQIAHFLKKELGEGEQIVAICMHRSVDFVLGILGILKAGFAFLPLDPEYPIDRIKYMIQDSNTTLILTDDLSSSLFNQKEDRFEIINNIIDKSSTVENIRDEGFGKERRAYVIYTSGSTGKPKGVEISHGNLIHSTEARFSFYPNQPKSFLMLSSFSFDSSMVGLFWTLCTGGTLIVSEKHLEQDIEKLSAVIQDNQVTHTLMLPTLYRTILKLTAPECLASLNTVIVAGEACSQQLVILHHSILPEAMLFNEYGPTEATIWCTAAELKKTDGQYRVPIGKPIQNARAYVLDDHLNPVPIGVQGELYIGGKGVAKGYLNDPAKTEVKFIDDPFDLPGKKMYQTGDIASYRKDGTLDFFGRKDFQIKVRGYRIELDEIKEALLKNPLIHEAVVVVEDANDQISEEQTDLEYLQIELNEYSDEQIRNILEMVERIPSE